MADVPYYVRSCLQSGKLALLAILVSGGIVLQILACALYNNWWPMLTVIMYVLLPMPLLFFAGSNASYLYSESSSGWIDATKFLTGASVVGSVAIPVILKHAGVIGWGALAMELSSFFIFGLGHWRAEVNFKRGYSSLKFTPTTYCSMGMKTWWHDKGKLAWFYERERERERESGGPRK